MKDGRMRKSDPSGNPRDFFAWFRDFAYQLLISWQLIWDQRIPLSNKLLPLIVLVYILSPIDLLPDAFLGPGQLDDLAVFLLGLKLFVSLAPPAIVEEYRKQLAHVSPSSQVSTDSSDEASSVIDLDARTPSGAESSGDERASLEGPSNGTSSSGKGASPDHASSD
jgi:uncharacterized membrane protein YkvA (DUF1232 family)